MEMQKLFAYCYLDKRQHLIWLKRRDDSEGLWGMELKIWPSLSLGEVEDQDMSRESRKNKHIGIKLELRYC